MRGRRVPNRSTNALIGLAISAACALAPVSRAQPAPPPKKPADLETASERPLGEPPSTARPREGEGRKGGLGLWDRRNRLTLLLASTWEESESDFTTGLEYERHLTEHWGIGGIFDRFEGSTNETLVALTGLYHPIHEVGFSVSPGYQFIDDDENRWAVRVGMFYEFEFGKKLSVAPAIYTDLLEAGQRSSILGAALSYSF